MPQPAELISAPTIATRVRELGATIASAWAGQPLCAVVVLDGAFCFAADLLRAIPGLPTTVHFVKAASYGQGTTSSGTVNLGSLPSVAGAAVLLIEDILDTGRTLNALTTALRQAGAASVRSVVLLDKPARRTVPCTADWVGFTIADRFVVGYGLDHAGRWRELPFVATLD